ncbi:DUF3298 domain-containing protein [Nitrospirillum viridazoti]|uniref:DUF3298 domain-containing protein n=1 Tax=Nitrospirillum viridazoti TaxID=3144925 RepID=UPI000AB0DC17|nr:DUF3298 domain-containing protein [Nitrospirillum amazonense]TWB44849.1 uncharacterized protein DUF1311 [Nitrospirillum amazonense]
MRLSRVLVCATGLLLLRDQAGAASFDCAKAETAVEKAICADPSLSAADEKLATAYRQTLASAPADIRPELVQNQHNWLVYVHRYCKPVKRAPPDGVSTCLGEKYKERLGSLPQSLRTVGTTTVYQMQRFDVATEAGTDGADDTGTMEFNMDQVAGTRPQDKQVNAYIRTLAKFPTIETQAAKPGRLAQPSEEIVNTYRLIAYTDHVAEIQIDTWDYGHGAAHGTSDSANRFFLAQEGKELTADRVFAAAKPWRAFLAKRCYDGLVEQGIIGPDNKVFTGTAAELEPMVAQPTHWEFDSDGLSVAFATYEVAPYAAGEPAVTIPWNDLRPYLIKDTPILELARVPAQDPP